MKSTANIWIIWYINILPAFSWRKITVEAFELSGCLINHPFNFYLSNVPISTSSYGKFLSYGFLKPFILWLGLYGIPYNAYKIYTLIPGKYIIEFC